MSDLSGPITDLFAGIGRQAAAERWGRDIIGTRTPVTGTINTVLRSHAMSVIRGESEEYLRGEQGCIAVMILAYTGLTDPKTIGAVMVIVIDYWLMWVKDNPNA